MKHRPRAFERTVRSTPTHMSGRCWVIGLIAGVALLSVLRGDLRADLSAGATTLPSEPGEQQIRRMVHRLNHPLPTQREAAVQQLAAWGPRCLPSLYEAAKGTSLEAALSARDLIAELQAVYLLGAHITLKTSKQQVAWDEPFDLTVQVNNPTPAAIRLPWSATPESTTQPVEGEAQQVAAAFDAGEFIEVTGPNGQTVELRVDPIDRSPEIQQVVNERAGAEPPSHLLPPGASTTLRVREYNRGWARIPMLEAGRYSIRVNYQPQWATEAWTEAGFGHVSSPPVEVVVSRAAPAMIRKAPRSTALRMELQDATVIARLVNYWDRPVWFNCNFGPDPTLHAQAVWTFYFTDKKETSQWQPEPTGTRFQLERVMRVEPMASVEIARESLVALRLQALREGSPSRCRLKLHYLHLPSAAQLLDRLRPEQPDAFVPSSLFTGSVSSEYIPLKPEPQPTGSQPP